MRDRILSVTSTDDERRNDDDWITYFQGVCYTDRGEYDKGIGKLTVAISKCPRLPYYLSRCLAYALKGDNSSADKDFAACMNALCYSPHDFNWGIEYEPSRAAGVLHEINGMLNALTGQKIEFKDGWKVDDWHVTSDDWQAWWLKNKDTYHLPKNAREIILQIQSAK